MSKTIEYVKKKFKKVKIEYVIAIFAVIAVLALFASSYLPHKKEEGKTSVENYVSMLENKLSKNLSKIDGAGNVSVIISVKRGLSNEIARETIKIDKSGNSESRDNPIIISGKPIILSEVYPEITGVIIIAKGADHLRVKMSLMAAAMTFLDVTSDKIEILTMK